MQAALDGILADLERIHDRWIAEGPEPVQLDAVIDRMADLGVALEAGRGA